MVSDNATKTNGVLPAGSSRIMRLVEKSQPSSTRPALPPEYEAQLQPVHARSAACYASMEDIGDKIERLSKLIAEDEGVIISEIDTEDSVVTHIEDVTMEIRSSHTRLAATSATTSQGVPTTDDDSTDESLPVPSHGRALTQ